MTAGSAPGRAAGPVRTIFFGSGPFAVPILEAVAAHRRVDLVAVVTAPDKPAGRSRTLTPTPVAARARALGRLVLQPTTLRSTEALADLEALRPDLGILADYGRIIPQAVLDLPRLGILGVHPSLLPRHRGATPIQAAILAGDAVGGVTLYRMDAGLDTGPVLAAASWPLDGDETAPALESAAALHGARLLTEALSGYLDGSVDPTPQSDVGATLTTRLRREDGRLDPSRPTAELVRQVRAHVPWPGSFVETAAGRLGVTGVGTAPAEPGDVAGTIVRAEDGLPALATSDGRLLLMLVQPQGGRVMTGQEFLRGHGDLLGTSVGGAATVSGR